LEINACPSLSIFHEATETTDTTFTGGAATESISVVDETVKVNLVKDTLLIATGQTLGCVKSSLSLPKINSKFSTLTTNMTTKKSSYESANLGYYSGSRSLTEIFPAQFGHTCGKMMVLDKAAFLFLQLVDIRRVMTISLSCCRTFLKYANFIGAFTHENS